MSIQQSLEALRPTYTYEGRSLSSEDQQFLQDLLDVFLRNENEQGNIGLSFSSFFRRINNRINSKALDYVLTELDGKKLPVNARENLLSSVWEDPERMNDENARKRQIFISERMGISELYCFSLINMMLEKTGIITMQTTFAELRERSKDNETAKRIYRIFWNKIPVRNGEYDEWDLHTLISNLGVEHIFQEFVLVFA